MRKKWPAIGVPDKGEFHHEDLRYIKISFQLPNFLPTGRQAQAGKYQSPNSIQLINGQMINNQIIRRLPDKFGN
jgi:hypothetical protein